MKERWGSLSLSEVDSCEDKKRVNYKRRRDVRMKGSTVNSVEMDESDVLRRERCWSEVRVKKFDFRYN